jgi:hypothetical protein
MSWFNQKHPRMDEYNKTHGQIPSSLSRAAESIAGSGATKPIERQTVRQDSQVEKNARMLYGSVRPWWDPNGWFRSGNGIDLPNGYTPGRPIASFGGGVVRDDETILDGLLTVSKSRGDVIVVPKGKMDVVPEKYRSQTIELEDSIGYAVIK